MKTLFYLGSLLLIGCAADGAGTPATCAGERVGSAAEVAACTPLGPWLGQLAPGAEMPISGDLLATNDLVLGANAFALPPGCQDCLSEFRYATRLDTVTLIDDAMDEYIFGHRGVRIPVGTRFRVRTSVYSEYPFLPVVIPLVTIVADTSIPCAADSSRCEADSVCYRGESLCNHCDGHSHQQCACTAADGTSLDDGTPCEFALSFDQIAAGDCQTGQCIASE